MSSTARVMAAQVRGQTTATAQPQLGRQQQPLRFICFRSCWMQSQTLLCLPLSTASLVSSAPCSRAGEWSCIIKQEAPFSGPVTAPWAGL